MESFKRRLKYYGIGFGIGMIFVVFFFQNRGCSWLPGNRVKNAVLDRLIVVSETTEATMKERGLSEDELLQVLNDGDVLFSESDKNEDSKVYLIEKEGVKYAFTLPYESFVSEVFIDVKGKTVKTSSAGLGRIIHFPKDDDLVFPDSTKLVTCQQDQLKLVNPRDILAAIKKTGKVDFARCQFEQRPKPLQYLIFEHNGVEVGAKVIWYKNKLNITTFEAETLTNCD